MHGIEAIRPAALTTDPGEGPERQKLEDFGIKPDSELSVRLIRTAESVVRRMRPRQHRLVVVEDLPRFGSEEELFAYIEETRLTVVELRAIAESLGADASARLRKADLIQLISELMFGITLTFPLEQRMVLPTSHGAEGIVGVINASYIAQWYETHGRRLLVANVRRYLQHDQVTENIAALTGPNREMFAFVNNGVTILVGSIAVAGNMVHAHKALVVNGIQTMAAIHEVYTQNRESVSGDVKVMLRIVVASDSPDPDSSSGPLAATTLRSEGRPTDPPGPAADKP